MDYLPGDVTDAGKAGVGLSANAGSEIPTKVIQPQSYGPSENWTSPLPEHGTIPAHAVVEEPDEDEAAQNEDEAGGG